MIFDNDFDGDIKDGAIDKNGDFVFISNYRQPEIDESDYILYRYKGNQVNVLHSSDFFYFSSGTGGITFKKDVNDDIWFQYQKTFPSQVLESSENYFVKILDSEIEIHTYGSLGIDLPPSSRNYQLINFDFENNMWLRNYESVLAPKVFRANSDNVESYDTHPTQITTNLHHGNIEEDCEGNIYISGFNGISMFDGQNWSEYNYYENGLSVSINGLFDDAELNPFTCELCFNVEFTSTAAMLCVKDGVFELKSFLGNVRQIEISNDGAEYYLTDEGLYIFDIDGTQKFYNADDFPGGWRMNTMTLGKNNELWFHNSDRNIYKLENEEWTSLNFDDHPFVDSGILKMWVDEKQPFCGLLTKMV